MSIYLTLLGVAFKVLILCVLVVIWIATRKEMMPMVAKEKKMARIGIWIMRISFMLMLAPFLFIGFISGLIAMKIALLAMIATGILAVIMRLYLEEPHQSKIPS